MNILVIFCLFRSDNNTKPNPISFGHAVNVSTNLSAFFSCCRCCCFRHLLVLVFAVSWWVDVVDFLSMRISEKPGNHEKIKPLNRPRGFCFSQNMSNLSFCFLFSSEKKIFETVSKHLPPSDVSPKFNFVPDILNQGCFDNKKVFLKFEPTLANFYAMGQILSKFSGQN